MYCKGGVGRPLTVLSEMGGKSKANTLADGEKLKTVKKSKTRVESDNI